MVHCAVTLLMVYREKARRVVMWIRESWSRERERERTERVGVFLLKLREEHGERALAGGGIVGVVPCVGRRRLSESGNE